MRDYFFLLLIAGGLPVILFRPFFGLLMWCWVAYMLPHKLGWGMIAAYPVAAMVGGLTLLAWLLSKEPKKIPMNGIMAMYFLMVLWWIISFIINERTPYAIQQFDKVMKIQLFTLLTVILVNTRQRLNYLVGVIALSIAFFGIKGGLFTLLTGGGSRVWGPPSGFFEGNNELGLTLLTILPLLRYLQTQFSKAWQRHAMTAGMVLCFIAALGTHSRGALLAAAAMSVYFWWRSDKKIPIAVAGVILIPFLYFFMPSNWHERMATIKVEQSETAMQRPINTTTWCGRMTAIVQTHDPSAGGRVNAWCYAVNRAQSEWFGGGFDAFNPKDFLRYAPDPYDFHDAHSIYFKILGEHGFIGFGLFMSVLLLSFFKASSLRKRAIDQKRQWAYQFANMLQVSMVSFGVGGIFLGLCYFDLLYHLIAMAVILDQLMKQPAEEQAKQNKTEAHQLKPRFANSLSLTKGGSR